MEQIICVRSVADLNADEPYSESNEYLGSDRSPSPCVSGNDTRLTDHLRRVLYSASLGGHSVSILEEPLGWDSSITLL